MELWWCCPQQRPRNSWLLVTSTVPAKPHPLFVPTSSQPGSLSLRTQGLKEPHPSKARSAYPLHACLSQQGQGWLCPRTQHRFSSGEARLLDPPGLAQMPLLRLGLVLGNCLDAGGFEFRPPQNQLTIPAYFRQRQGKQSMSSDSVVAATAVCCL